jgi:drug/metabolite transporter (DMT)-like permease
MNEIRDRDQNRTRWAILAGLVMTGFGITLALIIGNRLSDEALAVLAGAVCGVGAAIPTSLIVFAVSRRRDESRTRPTVPSPYQGSYPPVVVIAPPGAGQPRANVWNDLPPSFNAPTHRQFTVVGGAPAEGERVTYGS